MDRGIPPHMLELLSRAAATVENGHTLHDVVSRIRTQELRRGSQRLTVTIQRRVHPDPEPEPEPPSIVLAGKPIDATATLGGEATCAICLIQYKEHDTGTSLPCHHGFHKACLQEWTDRHPTCPICRLQLR